MILAIKTNDPTTEIILLDNFGKTVVKKTWESGKSLSDELLTKIEQIIDAKWDDLSGLIVFSGPGSFTGLRIGITTMNTLAYSLEIPIVGTNGKNWISDGLRYLLNETDKKESLPSTFHPEGLNSAVVIPQYGAEPNISTPKK